MRIFCVGVLKSRSTNHCSDFRFYKQSHKSTDLQRNDRVIPDNKKIDSVRKTLKNDI